MQMPQWLNDRKKEWIASEVVYYFDFRSPIVKAPGDRPLPLWEEYSAYRIEINGKVVKDKPPRREPNTAKALQASLEVGELKQLFELKDTRSE